MRTLGDGLDVTRLRMMADYLCARVIRPSQRTAAGLHVLDLPAGRMHDPEPTLRRWCGDVVAVGDSPQWDGVSQGDIVAWSKYGTSEFASGGHTYVVLHVDHVEAVIGREYSTQRAPRSSA